ncbi:hypothetical protein EHS13_11640 [Paenibacillus psychroresistens]|uniref:DUF4399 domain-containing protein n=1 Tax=Paenibacillus psychroresistens TaxID=1778678 RepID=A0A6B8RHX5_9BACL|nr:hypothetical protein [Paenibacillus psychroresistens]QGQ95487.1 hypothetical protein EHS13_11640 [Paenibacillus psychroresistens]
MNNKSVLLGSLLLLVILSGCTATAPATVSPQSSSASTPLPTMADKDTLAKATTTTPSFEIEGLHNGDIIANDEVNLQVQLNNFTLVDRNTEHTPDTNQGHIHYWLDSNPTDPGAAVQIDKDPEHILLSNLKAGQHILTVKLVGTDHQPSTETTTQIITFMVKRGNATDAATNSEPPKSENASPTPQPTAKSTANEADADSAVFSITGLKNGDIVTTQDLKFAIEVNKLDIVNYGDNPEAKAGEGHIHIWLDTTSTEAKNAMKVYIDPKHTVIKNIAEGEHTILVGLVGNDHQIIGDRQAITFSVNR